jgi:uncharacterized delta-60 repeat protein
MKSLRIQLIFGIVLLLSINAHSQDGLLDSSFNSMVIGHNVGAESIVRTISIRSDGKIIAGGDFNSFNNSGVAPMVLLNPDGSLANNPGLICPGYVYTSGFQNDGKIIIGGNNFILRLNADGSSDPSFNPGTGVNGIVQACKIQSDGKILIGGNFTSVNGLTHNRIARLNTDGSLDATFNAGTGLDFGVETLSILTSGKIIIGGWFTTFNGLSRRGLVCLNSDGSVDSNFNVGTGCNAAVHTTTIQNDGKILVGGAFTTFKGLNKKRIMRLNPDGSIDPSFYGPGASSDVYAILTQDSGRILIGGDFLTYGGFTSNYVARLDSNGMFDNTLVISANARITTILMQSDKKILIGGDFTTFNGSPAGRLVRLNTDYNLDSAFNSGTGADGAIWATCIQNDGKIIIAGFLSKYSGFDVGHLARLNIDGSLDTTFKTGTGTNNVVYTIAIQSDGKIIIGGEFTKYNNTIRNHIVRLNIDGSIDTSFNIGTGFNYMVRKVGVQNDGKILVSGDFTQFNGFIRYYSIRLNPDGSFDPTFGANTSTIELGQFVIQNDGKIIMGGRYNIPYNSYLTRINSDGTRDTSFQNGLGANGGIDALAVQNDGKIIITGAYITQYDGLSVNRIFRVNPDGSLDMTFNTGYGVNNNIYSITPQTNGKIIIGGAFKIFNGEKLHHLVRVNQDGSLDPTFDNGNYLDGPVCSTALQSDGKIIIAGAFSSYNGVGRSRIARLNNTNPVNVTGLPVRGNTITKSGLKYNTFIYPNPTNGNVNLNIYSLNSGYIEINVFNTESLLVYKERTNISDGNYNESIDLNFLPKGFYTIHVVTEKEIFTNKLIIF